MQVENGELGISLDALLRFREGYGSRVSHGEAFCHELDNERTVAFGRDCFTVLLDGCFAADTCRVELDSERDAFRHVLVGEFPCHGIAVVDFVEDCLVKHKMGTLVGGDSPERGYP